MLRTKLASEKNRLGKNICKIRKGKIIHADNTSRPKHRPRKMLQQKKSNHLKIEREKKTPVNETSQE